MTRIPPAHAGNARACNPLARLGLAALVCLAHAACGGKSAPPIPASPGNVASAAGDGKVTVSWDASAGASGYTVYWNADAAGAVSPATSTGVDAGSSTFLVISPLSNGALYRFAVTARSPGGESALSVEVKARPLAAGPLAQLAVDATRLVPADGATGISTNSSLTVAFNRPAQISSVTVDTGTQCSGSLLLSTSMAFTPGTCLKLSSPSTPDQGQTFHFASATPLTASTHYYLRTTAAVVDPDGVPASTFTTAKGFTTGSGIDTTPPGEVTSALVAFTALQTVGVSWTNPTDTDLAGVHFYLVAHGSSFPIAPSMTVAAGATVASLPVPPFSNLDIKLTTFDTSSPIPNESAGVIISSVKTALSGVSGDFLAGQTTPGLLLEADLAHPVGAAFSFTWTAGSFVAAVSTLQGAKLLTSNQDALWVAFSNGAPGGETILHTTNGNVVVWPFAANTVVQLYPHGSLTTVALHTAGTAGFVDQTGTPGVSSYDSNLSELAFPAALIGGASAKLQFAFAVVNLLATSGYAYALAPANPAANDVLGSDGSLTSFYAPGSKAFDSTTVAASVAASPLTQATSQLVSFTVTAPNSTRIQLKGSSAPLTYLTPQATGAPQTTPLLTAGANHVFTGRFNLGGLAASEIFFKFTDPDAAVKDEFNSGRDRVWTLGGGAETLPGLTFGAAYGATHPFVLNFQCNSCGAPTELRGGMGADPNLAAVVELGATSFGSSPVNTMATGADKLSVNAGVATASVTFTSHDFVSAPLNFKMYYGASFEGGSNHVMDDDVLNHRLLTFKAGDGTSF